MVWFIYHCCARCSPGCLAIAVHLNVSRTAGSSSGLHHDFHDNLYILLQGRKRFVMYSPSLAHRMYTQGKIAKVHSNGRIQYQGQVQPASSAQNISDSMDMVSSNYSCCHGVEPLALHNMTGGVLQAEVLPDGSRAHDVAVWLAETQLAAAEAAAAAAPAPSASRASQEQQEAVTQAEAALEAALAAAVMHPTRLQPEQPEAAEPSSGADSGGSFIQDWHDDFEASEEEGSSGLAPASPSSAVPGLPDNFSRVDLTKGSGEFAAEFPNFPGPSQAVVCELEAGEARSSLASLFTVL